MTAWPPSAATPKAAPAAVADAPPLAPKATSLCWVVDENASLRRFLSLVLHGAGIDALEFPDGATMRGEIGKRAPDLIFQNVSLESADEAPLCKTAIDLAHNFGSTVVGVGIEKAADAVALVSMGCDYGQGFLLGQPMPEDRFIALLRRRSGGETLQKTSPAPQTEPA